MRVLVCRYGVIEVEDAEKEMKNLTMTNPESSEIYWNDEIEIVDILDEDEN